MKASFAKRLEGTHKMALALWRLDEHILVDRTLISLSPSDRNFDGLLEFTIDNMSLLVDNLGKREC